MLDLAQLNKAYETDSLASLESLREYKEAKAYYHGHQLHTLELQKLEERGQLPIYENIYKMICDKILGYKLQSMQEIRVSGRQEQDKNLADLLNDLLRVFNQQKNYEKEIYKRDFELLLGCSIMELWVKSDENNDFHISVKNIPCESFLIDAYSTDKNASDASRFHKKQNISLVDAKLLLGANKEIFLSANDIADQRAFIIESWVKEQDTESKSGFSWNRYLWHTQGGIYSYERMPFRNNSHPFVISKYNIDEKFNFYGIFRDIKPIQDYINFAEIKMGNMLATTKALYEIDAVDDIDEFCQNITKDNAVVGVRSNALKENKIQFIQHHADIAALSQKSEQKRNMAKILSGLNDEALAMASNRQSGTAIAQRRESGLLGLQYFVASADNAETLLYEKVIELITHYYTKEQVFKIVDKKRGERYFSINTNSENKIKIGKFDLVYKTQLKTQGREERFMHWSEIFKTISSIRPDIISQLLPLMLKDTDSQIVSDIEEVLAKADELAAQNAQTQEAIAQKSQELEMLKIEAQIQKLQGESQKLSAQSGMLKEVESQMKLEKLNSFSQTLANGTQSAFSESSAALDSENGAKTSESSKVSESSAQNQPAKNAPQALKSKPNQKGSAFNLAKKQMQIGTKDLR